MTERERLGSEFDSLVALYDKTFKDSFPSIPLLNNGYEKCIEIIKDCLAQGKNVEELKYFVVPTGANGEFIFYD